MDPEREVDDPDAVDEAIAEEIEDPYFVDHLVDQLAKAGQRIAEMEARERGRERFWAEQDERHYRLAQRVYRPFPDELMN